MKIVFIKTIFKILAFWSLGCGLFSMDILARVIDNENIEKIGVEYNAYSLGRRGIRVGILVDKDKYYETRIPSLDIGNVEINASESILINEKIEYQFFIEDGKVQNRGSEYLRLRFIRKGFLPELMMVPVSSDGFYFWHNDRSMDDCPIKNTVNVFEDKNIDLKEFYHKKISNLYLDNESEIIKTRIRKIVLSQDKRDAALYDLGRVALRKRNIIISRYLFWQSFMMNPSSKSLSQVIRTLLISVIPNIDDLLILNEFLEKYPPKTANEVKQYVEIKLTLAKLSRKYSRFAKEIHEEKWLKDAIDLSNLSFASHESKINTNLYKSYQLKKEIALFETEIKKSLIYDDFAQKEKEYTEREDDLKWLRNDAMKDYESAKDSRDIIKIEKKILKKENQLELTRNDLEKHNTMLIELDDSVLDKDKEINKEWNFFKKLRLLKERRFLVDNFNKMIEKVNKSATDNQKILDKLKDAEDVYEMELEEVYEKAFEDYNEEKIYISEVLYVELMNLTNKIEELERPLKELKEQEKFARSLIKNYTIKSFFDNNINRKKSSNLFLSIDHRDIKNKNWCGKIDLKCDFCEKSLVGSCLNKQLRMTKQCLSVGAPAEFKNRVESGTYKCAQVIEAKTDIRNDLEKILLNFALEILSEQEIDVEDYTDHLTRQFDLLNIKTLITDDDLLDRSYVRTVRFFIQK